MSDNNDPINITLARKLRALADFVETRPECASQFQWSVYTAHIYPPSNKWDAVLRELGTFEKGSDNQYLEARVELPDGTMFVANQAKTNTCERVQVGTKTVTKTVPVSDEVKTIEVEEPQYEWVCPDSWLTSKEDA